MQEQKSTSMEDESSNRTGGLAAGARPLSKKSNSQLKREARARLNHMDPITASELLNEVVGKQVKGSVVGFVDFLRNYSVLALAVGFVLGTQVQTVVKQFITSFVDPTFKLLFPGDQVLSARKFTLHFDGRHADFGWGAVVYDIIDFLFITFIVYTVIRLFRLDKLDKPKT